MIFTVDWFCEESAMINWLTGFSVCCLLRMAMVVRIPNQLGLGDVCARFGWGDQSAASCSWSSGTYCKFRAHLSGSALGDSIQERDLSRFSRNRRWSARQNRYGYGRCRVLWPGVMHNIPGRLLNSRAKIQCVWSFVQMKRKKAEHRMLSLFSE